MRYRSEAWRTAKHPSRMQRIIFPFPKAPQRGDGIICLHYITRIGSVRFHCKTNQYSLWPGWPQLPPRRQAAGQPAQAPGQHRAGCVPHPGAGTAGHCSAARTGPRGPGGGAETPSYCHAPYIHV